MTGPRNRYRWVEDPVVGLERGARHEEWSHHGLSVTSSGDLVAFSAERRSLLIASRSGGPPREVPVPAFEAHDLLVVDEGGADRVWIADIGLRSVRQQHGGYTVTASDAGGHVLLVGLDGFVARSLPMPPVPEYRDGRYCPGAIAVDEQRHGGTGEVWVADPYGASLVHRFGADGSYAGTVRGDEPGGPGRLNCPHGLVVDRRSERPELLIADRGNARVLAYTLDGQFLRVLGADFLTAPSSLAVAGDVLIVTENRGSRLTLMGTNGDLIEFIGCDDRAVGRPGLPNALADDGSVVAPRVHDHRFNAPHGLAVGASGEVFVAEWVVGGRLVRLDPT